ncbi:MAG: nucleotidyltransferase domain-containing protein [Ignavibacteriaceae bacterium]
MGIYSKEFERILVEETLGGLTRKEYDEIFGIISNEFSARTAIPAIEANLIRLFKSVFSLSRFLRDCLTYPHFLPTIINIVSNSNYLTDILVRDPEYLYWIFSSVVQSERLDKIIINTEIKQRFSNTTSFSGRIRILKTIKRREILRIGFRDISQIDDINQTTLQLSVLARGILSNLFEICFEKKRTELGSPKISPQYSLIALGKLGGDELNYSSDVDLILFYREGITQQKSITYREFLSSVIQLFIRESTTINDEGFLFRIDFRLRPHGKDAPLCKSLEQTINYYEFEGEEWERQMLIKGSYLCGSKKLFNEFHSFINSFIYRSSSTKSPIEQILRLRKINIENQRDDLDIKQSTGGLRDIEFPIQGLQLIYGALNPSIRTGNTLLAINEMNKVKIIANEERVFLFDAYIFFRRIEHYLQLMNDNQTHRIPQSGTLLDKLVNFFGFREKDSFLNEIEHHKEKIKKFAASVYMDAETPTAGRNTFRETTKWKREKEFLSEGKGLSGRKMFDIRMTESFERIEENLETFLTYSIDAEMTIRNFVRIIRGANFPSIWYDLFLDKSVFKYLLTLCERSQKAIDLFAENKKLRDFFISGRVFKSLKKEYFPLLTPEELLFNVLSKYANNLISGFEAGNILSAYLKKRIKDYFDVTQKKTNGEYDGIMVLGFGSFSTGEMTFNSDIDLFFISKSNYFSQGIQEKFLIILNELQKRVEPFKIDSRLRPEGESGSLIWSTKSFNEYLKTRARSWEFQSYTRMNLIYGDKRSYNSLLKSITQAVSLRDMEILLKSSREMIKKLNPPGNAFNIKNSSGGLRESEYFSQILLLINKNAFIEFAGKTVLDILEGIGKYFPEYLKDAKILLRNRNFLIDLQLTLQTFFGGTGSILPTDNKKLTLVSKLLGVSDKDALLKRIETIRKENTLIFKKIIEEHN